MQTSFSNINQLWGQLIVEELFRNNVRTFSVSPGSRSTPLVLAIASNQNVNSVVHYDERGAAFYALGVAKATGNPVAIVCTSGTAAANFFPAIIEASQDNVPLIVLTADRPPELKNTGANQTIDQSNLYGNFVRFQCDMPCPDEAITPDVPLATIDKAVHHALSPQPGPVHLNCPYRKPLEPADENRDYSDYLNKIYSWMKNDKSYTNNSEPKIQISEDQLIDSAKFINASTKGVVVVGKVNSLEIKQIKLFSKKLGWPLISDIASGNRLGSEHCIPYFDLLLSANESQFSEIETVIQFGRSPVSKMLQKWLGAIRPKNHIQILSGPQKENPDHHVTSRIKTDAESFCKSIDPHIQKNDNSKLVNQLSEISKKIDESLDSILGNNDLPTEPAVCRTISKEISKDSALYLGNSLPVREMDMFASGSGNAVAVEYNRGVSGIDGTIASATGYANGLRSAVTLVIGDLTFLHDLNSLKLATDSEFPLTIVVFNNDGGGIFSFLPVAKRTKDFEKFFGTPHGLTFKQSAKQFGLEYFLPNSMTEFKQNYLSCQKSQVSSIIEIKTDRTANYKLHQQIKASIKTSLSG